MVHALAWRVASAQVALVVVGACAAVACGTSGGDAGAVQDASDGLDATTAADAKDADASRAADAGGAADASGSKDGAADASGSKDGAIADAAVADAPVGAESGVDSGPTTPSFLIGADITWTQQDVAGGATYVDNGVKKPIMQLLKDHGFNAVRMRTFVDPTQSAPNPAGGTFAPYSTAGFGDITHTVAYAQEIKAAGFFFLLDFHYSDTWADPGKQVKPAAWVSDNLAEAVTQVHDYTMADIQALVAAGGRPDMVQIGNEITPGMLLSPGAELGPTSDWAQLAQLLKAGIQGVHDVDPTIKIMLHIDRGDDLATSESFIDSAIANGVAFDVFGESCYIAFQGPPSGWQTTFQGLVAKYPSLKFAMAEYNADPANQTDNELRQANDIVFQLPNHQGFGTFFWEPTHQPNAQNPGMFTVSSNTYTAIPACIDQYDQMKTAYGL